MRLSLQWKPHNLRIVPAFPKLRNQTVYEDLCPPVRKWNLCGTDTNFFPSRHLWRRNLHAGKLSRKKYLLEEFQFSCPIPDTERRYNHAIRSENILRFRPFP